jgi:aerobic carbon-monoxide dehydrogenase medium subunit
VIPAKFDYTRPSSLDEAVSALSSGGEDAKVIAGGQSLLPLLRLRFSYPSVLVDVGGLDELRGVRDVGSALEIGALTTLYELTRDPLIAAHCGLLTQAAGTIADPAVRHRGTLGGALAHADPAGDLPAVVTALDATLVAAGPSGTRSISPADFFTDYLTTSLAPGEILTAIRVPKLDGWGYRYEKFHVTAQAWAIVGVAAVARRDNGHVGAARVGLTNMGSVPVRAHAVEEAATGAAASAAGLAAAAARADEGTNPPSDLRGAADYRRHLARVLTGRALATAAGVS